MKQEPVWTKEQSLAIEARDCSLAVSAAAGSGKTAVLTERIVGLLSEERGVDAARLAVVTYTKKAAAELEEKLYRAVAKRAAETGNPRLMRQLSGLGQAQISTIHSLAFSLIREYKRHLDLPEKCKIADETEAELMRRAAVEKAVKEKMANLSRDDEPNLISLFGSGNSKDSTVTAICVLMEKSKSLERGLLSLYDKYEESLDCLCRAKEGKITFWDAPHGQLIKDHLKSTLSHAEEALSQAITALQGTVSLAEKYLDPFREAYFSLQKAISFLESGNMKKAEEILLCLTELKLPVVRKVLEEERDTKEFCQKIWRDWVTGPIESLFEKLLGESDGERLEGWEKSLLYVKEILDLATRSEELFTAEKREAGLLDYSDLEHLTLSLLAKYENGQWVKTPLAESIREEFDAIFVDEYQDTNGVQDLIFRLLAPEGRLFVVGDPKQSIYRFRGAEPSIFTGYKNELPLYEKGKKGMQKILLSHNFRCDEPVINLVNFLFSRMMEGEKEKSLYQKEDHLHFSKKPKENEVPLPPEPAELVLITKSDPNRDSQLDEEEGEIEREAHYLAARIRQILRNGEVSSPSEIAVLFRSGKQIPIVREHLERLNIPCAAGGSDEWKEDAEFLFLSSLFAALENPMRDIPLLGALTSPVFRLDEDEAFQIRSGCRHATFYQALTKAAEGENDPLSARCREILEEMAALRQRILHSTLSEFVFYLYRRWSLDEIFAKEGRKSGVVKAHVLSLCAALEPSGAPSIGDLARRMASAPFQGKGDEKSGVQLMTMHASKGLEFPVVFVSFLSLRFKMQDEYSTLLISPRLGAAASIHALQGRAKITPAVKHAVRLLCHREMVEEEKRILYVALTRAERKVILTGTVKDRKSLSLLLLSHPMANPKRLMAPLLENATSPLGLILPCLWESSAFSAILSGEKIGQEKDFTVSFMDELPEEEPILKGEDCVRQELFDPEKVLRDLEFVYPHAEAVCLPNKLSVSRLLSQAKEEESGEYYPIRLFDFENGTLRTGAERIGTATHQVMQFCSFAEMEKDPQKEFDRLVEKGFLSRDDMALVDRTKFLSFFSSPLYREMKESVCVEREKRFNVLLSGEELGVGKGEVLVQGVVDAWFENPDGTLTILDFKTDRVKPPEGDEILRNRHGEQLRLYAVAVEKMTGKKVSRLYLYSFALEKEIPV